MELTAKEILEKHSQKANGKKFDYSDSWILAAMKEAVELAFEAGDNFRSEQFALNIGIGPAGNQPNKQEFINSLFPESK
jgi:hypothetical protein